MPWEPQLSNTALNTSHLKGARSPLVRYTRAFDINKDIDKELSEEEVVESRRVEMLRRAFLTSPAFELKIKRRDELQMQEQKSKQRVPQSVLTLIVDDLKIAWSLGVRDSVFGIWGSISKRISNQSKVNEYYRNWLLHLYEPRGVCKDSPYATKVCKT